MNKVFATILFLEYLVGNFSYAQDIDDLELLDPSEM